MIQTGSFTEIRHDGILDFTVRKYSLLLEALSEAGYAFRTVSGFLDGDQDNSTAPVPVKAVSRAPVPEKAVSRAPVPEKAVSRAPVPEKAVSRDTAPGQVVVLRHDVDLLPENAMRFARLEAEMGISATYYFRIVPQSFDRGIIRAIHELGHEIGYHSRT